MILINNPSFYDWGVTCSAEGLTMMKCSLPCYNLIQFVSWLHLQLIKAGEFNTWMSNSRFSMGISWRRFMWNSLLVSPMLVMNIRPYGCPRPYMNFTKLQGRGTPNWMTLSCRSDSTNVHLYRQSTPGVLTTINWWWVYTWTVWWSFVHVKTSSSSSMQRWARY
jgi:hypothetical protein